MCSWERFCTFAREPERRTVGPDRRSAMEEIGARVTMLTLDSLQGGGLSFLTWLLERCKRSEIAVTDLFTEEALTTLAERLTTPLQFIHYAWRALEEAYVVGQKSADVETVQSGH